MMKRLIKGRASGVPESRWAPFKALGLVLLGALILPAVIWGCGSGGTETSVSGPTKGEFRKQAAAICKRSAVKRRAALKAFIVRHPNGKASRAQEEEAMTETLLPPIDEAIKELKKLGTPEGDQSAKALVRGLEEGMEKVQQNLPAYLDGTLANAFRRAEVAANAQGLAFCTGL